MEDQFRAICGSPIWNTEVVYASFPDFTFCFQYTILKWIPCAALWMCAPFWTYMLTRTVQYKLKFSLVSLLKIISTMFLISIELFYLTKAINNSKFIVHYMTPMILIVTYILVLLFDHFERVRGLRSSSLLFAFWLLQFLCSSITFRSKILYHIHYNHHTDFTEVYLFYVYYAICIFELVVSTFSEKFADKSYHKSQKKMKMTPENLTPLLSKITYLWIDPLIRKGFRRSLMRTDVWEVEASETSELIAEKFEREWDSYIQRYNRLVEQENNANHNNNANNNNSNNKKVTAMYKTTTKNNEEELILKKGVSEMDVKNTKHVKEPSLIWCLCKVFGGKFLAGTFLKFVSDLLCFAPPILLDLIIKFVNDKDQTMLVGIFLAILLFLSSIAQSMLLQHYYFRSYLVGARIRTALVNLIYKKTFRLSTQSRNASTGTVTNLVAVNAQLFLTITAFLNMLWSSPFQIVICIYMLWHYLGIAAIAGLATTIIFIPLNVIAANLNKTLSVKKLESQDMRLKLLTEMLNGIKVIKFYGWELSFQRIIDKVRNEEMGHYTRFALVGIIQSFTWSSAPFFVAAVSYATFTLTSDRILDPPTAFVSFTLFYLIRFPLALLPQTITMLIQGYVALKRIKSFLLLEETNENDIKHENTGEIAIMMKNVYVGWEKNVPFLCNLNFEIKKKKLYAVVGGIGSGKSSLLSALLGEMYKLNEGKINVNGSIAYVSQQAWIQNSTVRDNILFGRDYNELYYNRVISACSLLADFDIMPLRDKTEIGERGINLSGGQKQRISLARALYAKADIYLLDDPLSAVDAHVGKSIFDNVVGPNGLLKNKTRLFVTNSLCFLPQVDQIIMLDGGTIAEIGTYDELRNKESGTFAEFIRNFLANNELNNRIMESAEAQVQEKRDKPIQEEDIVSELGFKGKPLLHKQDSMGSHYGSDFFHNVRLNHNTGTPSRTDGAIIDKENIQSGTIKLSVVLDYMKKSGIANGVIFIILFLMSNVALSASSFWLSTWSNDSENPEKAKELKTYRLTVYLILGCIQCILLNISNIFLVLMYLRAARLYHKKLLFSILRSTLHFFESTPIGRIINRFSRDIESLETAIPDSFKICLFCLSNIIHTFIILAYTTPFSLLLILPSTIIYIFIQRYYVSSARQLTRLDSTTKSPIFSHLSETFSGVSTIRAYRSQATFSKRMQKHVDENTVYLYTGNCAERWLIVRLDFIANLITGLASMFAVFSRNSLSPGLVGLSISLSITVSQALNFFVKMGAEFEANITAVERIREYFNIPHEAKWTLDNNPAEGTAGTGTSGVGGKSSVISSSHVWPTEGRLEFREYSAKYSKNNDYVLNEINAVILPGEKIGIVGRTGAGKSSLTLALFRLIEVSEGDIIIDDVNINKIGLHDLRHNITIIPQDPIIFSGTIRMNLDPFEKHTDDEIWTALELAHLKDFLVNTEEKLDFECKEDGKNLSLGQRQLICLARALLRKNKILILDEATAAVDHNTDELIQQTIRSEFKNNTVLTIAHRLNTIMDSSRIMVLDRGRIVEFDTPENLLANKNGYFYSMSKDANLTE